MCDILKAAKFAALCHRGQFRKYNHDPYIYHVMRVAGRTAIQDIATNELVIAAWLHDVIEDCGVKRSYIDYEYGSLVEKYVSALTNTSKSVSKSRQARKILDAERIKLIPNECKVIKLIDRIDNLREIPESADFAKIYAKESLNLLNISLRGIDEPLENEYENICNYLLGNSNEFRTVL